jgi:tetratricopeptide (TPR) repeat protein
MIGKTSKAIEFFKQHLSIARKNGNKRGEGNDLGNIGLAYYVLGDIPKAIESLERSLAINRGTGNRYGEEGNLNNLGIAHAALSDSRKAIEYYKQAQLLPAKSGIGMGKAALCPTWV